MTEHAASLVLGRDLTGDWNLASRREWLVTNNLGGFAAGTVSGANTRRYHGLLVASLTPPVQRTVLLAKVDVRVNYQGRSVELGANEFSGGVIHPQGYAHIESFRLLQGIPTWRYAIGDALLEQQIFMAPLTHSSYLGLRLLRAGAAIDIALQPLCTYRDYHSQLRGERDFRVDAAPSSCTVLAFDGARALHLSIDQGSFEPGGDWYWNFFHRRESERGLDAVEDLFMPGRFATRLVYGEHRFFVASIEALAPAAGLGVLAQLAGKSELLTAALPAGAPSWVRQLALASDQFLVRREVLSQRGSSVIAGYPWFTDWGRDAMIALPGLTSTLGRHDIALEIIETFTRCVDHGMLPNRFPDGNEPPEYNTADATLWLFHALSEYLDSTHDGRLPQRLLPTLLNIIQAHVEGTRFGIGVDPSDGLLRAGEHGVQLTWMDAKVGDWVVTPRIGKCVEVNALWLNALQVTARLAAQVGNVPAAQQCQTLLAHASAHFDRFWNAQRGCLYDVIDVDGTAACDASMRPNQLFAVSLPFSPLQPEQMRAVVDACAGQLLTSYGLRSLGPHEPAYVGHYQGDVWHRDGAYHQGTVWSWLLGPFALAHYRVYGDAAAALSFLDPVGDHLRDACLGSISEIFDGDAPHVARGCFAQAWSVAEVLRAWVHLERLKARTMGRRDDAHD
jgi:predicted glycogen debranching enzyme